MKLPDLPPAPSTDLQFLLRSLLERDDFTAIEPILDELQASGRTTEASKFSNAIARDALTALHQNRGYWSDLQSQCLQWFWFDLFDRTATIQLIAKWHVERERQTREVPAIGESYSPMTGPVLGTSFSEIADRLRQNAGFPPVQEGGNGT